MRAEQLSQRIGNVEEALLEEAANFPLPGQNGKRKWLRRAGAIAAALMLMAGSFSAGALVWAKEPETVTIVKEPEAVEVGDTGISLILPESWAGKYGVRTENLEDGGIIEVYHLGIWERFGKKNVEEYGDTLDIDVIFRVSAREGELPVDYNFGYWGARVLAVKDGVSYVLSRPGGAIGATDDEMWQELHDMSMGITEIKILLSDWLKENSYNSTNWKEGTVTVDLYDKNEFVKPFFCDEEHSKAIREIAQAQDYCLDLKSFYYDAWLSFGKTEYIVSLETGDIEKNGFGRAQLSEEDLAKLKALLEEAESTSISQPGG